MERTVRLLVDFSARVLYYALTRHIGHDKAYQRIVREMRKATSVLPPKVLYWVSHDIISDYYTVRYVEEKLYGSTGGAKRAAKLWLILRGVDKEYLQPYLPGVERLRRRMAKTLPKPVESLDEILDTIDSPAELLAVKHSYPTWFAETMVKLLGFHPADRLLSSLNVEKWWIRVNTLKADPEKVAEKLEARGVVVRRDPDLDYMLEVVDFSEPLHHLGEMWTGEIVFQDKASAMVVEALEPEPGDVILDMAAAPGVKDTLIMQLTGNKARIVLVDVSTRRIERTVRLLKMYGVDLTRVDIVQADSTTLKLRLKPTKVLLDAPCTSSGAVGKDPAIKLHLGDRNWVAQFPPLQHSLLQNALSSGADRVVYATCSILPFEGEEHIAKLARQTRQLELVKPRIRSAHGYSVYPFAHSVARFFPHLHGTQGFFISLMALKG
jgi:16S rRNA (cytosine967-C5)-methyltransferase